ncbi:electron transport complex subunit RsxC [Vibrio scophthalmi]|uniref:Ion-translocating oxidoreductase complex subunit C n=1 Tax=Vibrio scophthalmi TaxID=45658 RepID=A0A1E3WQI2_9VIBR|nr:electron transport complex subunit RsxC [Vibrio scophthalmi]ODS12024.1 Electron transport complex subunit [Vibrio scophthalmi]
MLSLIKQIKTGALWDFPGGVHPPENKHQSLKNGLERAAIAKEIVLPIKQHIGKPGNLIVNVGERVLKGQPLTKYDMSFMLPVHAPTSGVITAIEPRTTAHPSGLAETCIVIEPDFKEEWAERNIVENFSDKTPEELLEVIRQAGISGMGGAGFPTAKKIQAGLGRTEILIINAAECEPYITADDVLMQQYADAIIQGIEIVEYILKPKLTIIGIEDNKPQAIKALELAAQHKDIVIRVIPTKYPSGGEKQLIKVLTNKEVPNNGIPADIGLLVQNVGSLYAIQRAICHGEPLIERIVTLTGNSFSQPKNIWTLVGTPVQALLDEFGYKEDRKLPRLIMGGPMMGFTLPHANVPITKTSNCILAPTRREIVSDQHEMACIRCGACAEACPASLLPQQLQWYAKAQDFDKCEELNIKDCIECGACAFVCPSEIPLVQYYRQAKAEIRTRKEEAESAERARQRFEHKKLRLERDKAERENRFKKAADERRQEMTSSGGDDAIAAAIARVKAQKSQSDTGEAPVKPAVAAAIARAKAKQAQAMQQGQTEPDNSEMAKLREERKRQARERKAEQQRNAASEPSAENSDKPQAGDKQSAVAAAIARAKAKKAQQATTPATEPADAPVTDAPNAGDAKKAAVAAAIARAKARKAEPTSTAVETDSATQAEAKADVIDAPSAGDAKKAAVAAAIARAKARKAEQATEPGEANAAPQVEAKSEVTDAPSADDAKKAAVAAAIARAKARKAEQATEPGEANAAPPVEAKSEVTDAPSADDAKKAAVAAAIARAKARKAEQATAPVDANAAPQVEAKANVIDAPSADDAKKAAVAAAIARAKARKAEQAAAPVDASFAPQVEAKSEVTDAPSADDAKKAAVAAAIARAKARKAQQEQQKQSEEKE